MSNFQGLDVADAVGWSPDDRKSALATMGRRRLNQVVDGRQLGGHHRLLLLQDVLQAGVGEGPVR